jgi:hypothetical protein
MTPGAKSQPLDDIRCVAWNRKDSPCSFHCLTNSRQFILIIIDIGFFFQPKAAFLMLEDFWRGEEGSGGWGGGGGGGRHWGFGKTNIL